MKSRSSRLVVGLSGMILVALLLQGCSNPLRPSDSASAGPPLQGGANGVAAPTAPPVKGPYTGLTGMGMPSAPQAFYPSTGYDVTVDERSNRNLDGRLDSPMPMADHGPNCEPPTEVLGTGNRHTTKTFADSAYICHDHVMTSLFSEGYAAAYIQPDAAPDWSNGTVTVSWRTSTFRTSARDWWDAWITPFGNQMPAPLHEWLPDLNGEPMNALHIEQVASGDGVAYAGQLYSGGKEIELDSARDVRQNDYVKPSRTVRTLYQLEISKNHIKFWLPEVNLVYIDQDINVPFTSGVLQLAHHSYNPEKDDGCGPPQDQRKVGQGCQPNTWHWSNINMSYAQRYTITHPSRRFMNASANTATFPAPAVADTYLRFLATGVNYQASFDGGKTWQALKTQASTKDTDPQYDPSQFFVRVPIGATSVQLRAGGDGYGAGWFAHEFVLMTTPGTVTQPPAPAAPKITGFSPARGAPGTSVTITGTGFAGTTGVMFGTATTTRFKVVSDSQITVTVPDNAQTGPLMVMGNRGDATSSSTFTVDGSTSKAINHVPCTVTIDGKQQQGTCDGTFTPN